MAYSRVLSHVDDRPGLIFMACAFSVLCITLLALRFAARKVTLQRLEADDWTALASLILVLALNGIFLGGTIQGAITGNSHVVDDMPVTSPLEHLVERYKYAFQSIEKPTFALIKISILLLWKRIFGIIRWFRILCWVMIVITALWGIAFFFATIFQCGTDWYLNWAPIFTFLEQCSNSLNMLTVFATTDIITDLIIIFMPVPVIWNLQMPVKERLGTTVLFTLGFFTLGAGIARLYIYLVTSYDKQDNPNFIADFTLFILWSEIELNVAMMVCCMPILAPIASRISRGVKAIPSSTLFSSRAHLASRDRSNSQDSKAEMSKVESQSDQESYIKINTDFHVRDADSRDGPMTPQACYIWDVERYPQRV